MCSREEKAALAEIVADFEFNSPYGSEIQRGCGTGSACTTPACCPSTACSWSSSRRRACSRSSAAPTPSGVGINVPIRTVLFTRLCKYDGRKTAHPQRARLPPDRGAGRSQGVRRPRVRSWSRRRSTSSRTCGWPSGRRRRQEVRQAEAARAQLRQLGHRDLQAVDRRASPSRSTSRFQVSHGMLLNVLSRPGDGCGAMRRADPRTATNRRRPGAGTGGAHGSCSAAWWRATSSSSSRRRKRAPVSGSTWSCRTTSPWTRPSRSTCSRRSRSSTGTRPATRLDLLTLVESILENPEVILPRQLDRIKDRERSRR